MDAKESKENKTRASWGVGSVCLIYSRSDNKWYDGQIEQIVNDNDQAQNQSPKKEWLIVRYKNDKKRKRIQRNCPDLKPIKALPTAPSHKTNTNCTQNKNAKYERTILKDFQDRIHRIDTLIGKTKHDLSTVNTMATDNINTVNQRCDAMIGIIETYRSSLLNDINARKHDVENELKLQLRSLMTVHNVALETNDECQQYVTKGCHQSPGPDPFRLVHLHNIIHKGYTREQQFTVNIINNKAFSRTITLDFNQMMKQYGTDQLNTKMNISAENHYQEIEDDKVNVIVPLEIKHDIVLTHWYRTCGDASKTALSRDVMHLIHTFVVSASSLGDTFDSSLNYASITLNADGSNAMKHNTGTSTESVFGSMIATPGSIYTWRVKMSEIDYVNIGVIECGKCEPCPSPLSLWWLSEIGYAYFSWDGSFYHQDDATWGGKKQYGRAYATNDVIDVCLDLKQYIISFGKNSRFFSGQNVKDRTDYKLAIAMDTRSEQSVVQLLKCSIT
eukprot:389715_1